MEAQNMRTITSTVELITPDQARVIIETMPYKGQRPIREKHVFDIANEMMSGGFATATLIQLAFISGKWALLDGQHRLRAVVRSNTPCVFTVLRHTGISEEEAAGIYGKTDRQLSRTPGDDAIAHDLPERLNLGIENINILGGSVSFMYNNFKNQGNVRDSIDGRRKGIVTWSDHFKTYHSYINDSRNGRIWKRTPVVAVGIITVMYSKDDRCEKFWRGCAADDGLRIGDPRKALISWLNYASVSGRGTLIPGRGRVKSRPEQARAVATAWNAFYEGRSLSLVKVINPIAPIVILGTPYDGIWNADETDK